MSDFGDWEPDDAFALEPLDAEQTARHMHELREYLAAMAGDELIAFDALSEDDRDLSVALGTRLVEFMVSDPDDAPWTFHETVAYFSDAPEWEALSQDARDVALGLIDDILAWAVRQGALR